MKNYRIKNLETLIDELKKSAVTILDKIDTFNYGKIAHVPDIEENKNELWENNSSRIHRVNLPGSENNTTSRIIGKIYFKNHRF